MLGVKQALAECKIITMIKYDKTIFIGICIVIPVNAIYTWILRRKIENLQKKLEKSEQEKDDIQKKLEKSEQEKDDLQKKLEKSEQEKETLQKKLEKSKEKKEILQKEIDNRKIQFKYVWRNAPLYADWRKEEFHVVNLTMDEESAHPILLLSEERRQITWQEKRQDLPFSPQRFDSLHCVLGQLKISSGRYYWEVDVENMNSWDLGICRDNVERKKRITISPNNGFWAIRFYEGQYWAVSSPETSLILRENFIKVGIFLDYDAGDISFYNMSDGSQIFSFPKNTFNGVLRPFFRLWNADSGTLRIVHV